ncbi:hypothetical protein C8R46DRAFT_1096027 [Mycena filopes]|nr:hypothetical protein C8R46DRAFT_1096027 [Mycena filopes]
MEPPLPLDDLVSLHNEPLPASEAHLAHSWILEAEKELARVEGGIQTLELRRQNLESRRLELRRSLEIYRRAVAPHKTLPVELLREIFRFCAATSDLNDISASNSNDEPPTSLCAVCSRWRTVALDTHELWSDVRVDFPERRNPVGLLHAVELWFSRSGTHPVTLDITATSPDDGRIHQLIVEYSGRFRSLSMNGLPLRSTLFTQPPRAFEQLETLDLVLDVDDDGTVVPPLFANVVTPKLRSLTLHGSHDQISLTQLQFPCHTLTCLDFRSRFGPISDYYLVLEECKSLITASFVLWEDDGDIRPATRVIFLPSLRELRVTTDLFREAVGFLGSIVVDSLTDLEIKIHDPSDESVTSVRPFPSLLRLRLRSPFGSLTRISAADLCLLLHACPAAVAVSIQVAPSDSTLDQIANGTLLPDLQRLGLFMVHPAALLRVLNTRREGPHSTIARAAGWPLRKCTADEVESFRNLLAMGVFVSTAHKEIDADEVEKCARADAANEIGYYGESQH